MSDICIIFDIEGIDEPKLLFGRNKIRKLAISNPKVFISYAWSTKEYQEKVLFLATDLENDGIQGSYCRKAFSVLQGK